MCTVIVNSRDPRRHIEEVNHAIREFKKKVKRTGILQDLRKYEHYTAPSKRRRLKAAESLKQRKRDDRKAQWQNQKYEF